jgi:hypothetical protein
MAKAELVKIVLRASVGRKHSCGAFRNEIHTGAPRFSYGNYSLLSIYLLTLYIRCCNSSSHIVNYSVDDSQSELKTVDLRTVKNKRKSLLFD